MAERVEIEDGGPAFPVPAFHSGGLTVRDYFAGQAMGGIVAVHPFKLDPDANSKLAGMAYALADAMLKARKAGQ